MKHQVLKFEFALLYSLTVFMPTLQAQQEYSTSDSAGNVQTTNVGPVVNDWHPKTGSINSVIELRGVRLYPQEIDKAKVFFIQNGLELPVRAGGGSGITNDQHNGPQTLNVIVPEEVVYGPGQFVVELNGKRSTPATVMITEWKPPLIRRVTPLSGAPGTFIEIECEGFHIDDEIVLTDAEGQLVRFDGGGSSRGTGFGIPKDTPEGALTIRLGNRKYGNGQFTEPHTITVTNNPLPLQLTTNGLTPVAPGQWLDLQAWELGPLKNSERTEVAFTQAGRTIVVTAPKPFRPHVEVPGALTPGEVQLQARTWRNGRPSEWSEPLVVYLADKPVAPSVAGLRTESGSWVHLWPGPDRASSFSVNAGDGVVMNGLWPVADAGKLKVLLVRRAQVLTLSVSEVDEKADWFSDVRVRLPESLTVGEWRMIVSCESDGTQNEVPIPIRVIKKN